MRRALSHLAARQPHLHAVDPRPPRLVRRDAQLDPAAAVGGRGVAGGDGVGEEGGEAASQPLGATRGGEAEQTVPELRAEEGRRRGGEHLFAREVDGRTTEGTGGRKL